MRPGSFLLSTLLAGSVLAIGCKDKGDDTGQPGEDGGASDGGGAGHDPELTAPVITFDEQVPTVATVTWRTDSPGTSWVSFGLDAAEERSTPQATTPTTEHSVTVLGLAAGRPHSLIAYTELEDGRVVNSAVQTVAPHVAPAEVPTTQVSEIDETRWAGDGYILTSYLQANNSFIVIIDRRGNHVWYREAAANLTITTSAPGRDGASLVYAQYDRAQKEDEGGLIRQAITGGPYQSVTRTYTAHHAFAELPDSQMAWLGLDLYDHEVDDVTSYIALDAIYETAEGDSSEDGYQTDFLWHEHGVPQPTCEHFFADAYGTGARDWTHGNSLMYDEYDDAFYLMSKNVDTILKIDRATGVVIWTMGGLDSDFTIVGEESDWWSHAHMSYMGDGQFTLFDNRYHSDDGEMVSRASHYTFDEATMTVQRVWTYQDPNDNFIELLGDVRILPNGNYLVSWTSIGIINEITPDGDVVWSFGTQIGSAVGRVHYLADLYDLTDSY